MMPALLPFYPSLAANILRYRYNSLDESNKIARVFGYNGSMFAWTAYVFIIKNFQKKYIYFLLDHILVDHK
jgi:trehalose/maltose hydrolase-like predicted phosphorylase